MIFFENGLLHILLPLHWLSIKRNKINSNSILIKTSQTDFALATYYNYYKDPREEAKSQAD